MKQGQKKKSKKVEFNLETILNNPVSKKQLEGFVEELELCFRKMLEERESIKDITGEAKDSLGIPSKILKGLVGEKMNPGSIDHKHHEITELSDIADGLGIKE